MLAGSPQWRRRTRTAVVVGLAVALLAPAAALAASAERPAGDVTKYVASLRAAAKLAEQARAAAGKLSGANCAGFVPAARQLVDASSSAHAVFQAYQNAKTRYGTQEEIGLISSLGADLREAHGLLGRAAGETGSVSAAQQRAAQREVSAFQSFVAQKIADRLQVEGLADVLRSTSFRQLKTRVVQQVQDRLRQRAQTELKRLIGLRVRLNAPLKQQIHDFLDSQLSSTLSRLAVSAGPAGIIVSLLGTRLVSLIGAKLKEALRHKGSLGPRTTKSIKGFENLQQQLRVLPKDATLDRVRAVVRKAERALGATKFLEGDLAHAHQDKLLGKLRTAKSKLQTTITVARLRFLLDSELMGADFRSGIRFADSIGNDTRRLAKKTGCSLSTGGTKPADKGTVPSAKSCPPPFAMETISSLPPNDVTGQFDVTLSGLEKTSTYQSKCLYVTTDTSAEAFVIWIDFVPPGVEGALPSGNCDGGRTDSSDYVYSRKRYLTVSGGERMSFTRAAGGNDKILHQALALAEAQGVGQACTAK